MIESLELHPIIPDESVLGADPKKAVFILCEAKNRILRQTAVRLPLFVHPLR
jgi:hypothetical protein